MARRLRVGWGTASAATIASLCALLVIAAPAAARVSAPEVSTYAESFDVPKAVAEERLEVQTKGARAHIGEGLEEQLDNRYGGLWFDNDTGEYVVALATPRRSQAAGRAAVAGELFAASLGSDDYSTAAVDSSWPDLLDAQKQVNEELASFFEQEIVRTHPSAAANAVVVEVSDGASDAVQEALVERIGGIGLDVQIQSAAAKTFEKDYAACNEAIHACTQPMRGGVGISEYTGYPHVGGSEFCTAGFRARGLSDHKPYILTAGHCVKEPNWKEQEKWESVVWNWEASDLTTSHHIGPLVQWHWPGSDWGKIDATDTWADTYPWWTIVLWGQEEQRSILGTSESIEGNQACHSGITTGTSCGTITNVLATETVQGSTVHNLAVIKRKKQGDNLCIDEGDSGGPVYVGNYALGIVSNGLVYGDGCEPESEMSYAEIDYVSQDAGVAVYPTNYPPGALAGTVTGFPGPHQATVTGSVNPGGISANYHFDYGTTEAYGSSTAAKSAGSAAQFASKSETLANLKSNTTYHFRVVATNSLETAKSEDRIFTTPFWKPLITPQAPTEVKVGHANLNALVNPQGSSTSYRFEWGKASEGFPNKVPVPDGSVGSGTSNVAVSQEITGLKGLTEYHWRVVATNEDGTTESATQTFTTPDWRPVVTTEAQTGVKVVEEAGQATLHGKVNPKGFDTDYRFEWGTQAEFEAGEYNNLVPIPDGEVGSGEGDVPVSAVIGPIKGQTTYHYRLVAENVEGQSPNPEDRSFTTPDWRPAVGWADAIGEDADSATLVSRIYPKGFATTYRIEWGTQAEFEAGEYNNTIEGGEVLTGDGPVEVEKELSGLQPRKAYHFRVIAENAEGSKPPWDVLFKTSTSGWVADGYPATVHGTPVGAFYASFGGYPAECEGPSLEGGLEKGPESFRGGAEILATPPGAFSCEGSVFSYTWQMNGCDFEFDPGYGSGGSFEGEFDIGPPGCGPITLNAGLCPIEIPPQIGRSVSFDNAGEGSGKTVRADIEIDLLRYKSLGGPLCPASEEYGGVVGGTWQFEAEDSYGSPTGLEISGLFEVGPDVTTQAATEVGATRAKLNGLVDTLGFESAYAFEYGTTTEYGETAYGGVIEGSEGGPEQESVVVEGLQPDTTYHFRIAGLNGNGDSRGEDMSFTTTTLHPARFEPGEYPASISGEMDVETEFSSPSADLSCETADLSGDSISAPSASIDLDAEYEECQLVTSVTSPQPANVTMNSCRYTTALDPGGPPYAGAYGVSCASEGDKIQISALGFVLAIGEQEAGGSLSLANEGEGSAATVALDGTATGVKYTCLGANCILIGLENGGTYEDGSLEVDALLGAEGEGDPVGLSVTGGEADVGLFLEEDGEGDPLFAAQAFPASISGEMDVETEFSSPSADLSCETAGLSGASISAPASSIDLDAEYEECQLVTTTVGSQPATVAMNSCGYTTALDPGGPPYTGAYGVSCASEGDEIQIISMGVVLAIGEQEAGGSLSLANEGEGSAATVALDGTATGVKYTCLGANCILIGLENGGTYEDGSLDVDASLGATYFG